MLSRKQVPVTNVAGRINRWTDAARVPNTQRELVRKSLLRCPGARKSAETLITRTGERSC